MDACTLRVKLSAFTELCVCGWGFRGLGSGGPAQSFELTQVSTKVLTHRLLSSSFLGLPYRILNMSHKKELLRSLWVPYFCCKGKRHKDDLGPIGNEAGILLPESCSSVPVQRISVTRRGFFR